LRGESTNAGNWVYYVNQAFGIIGKGNKLEAKTWSGADLTLSGLTCAVPADCNILKCVEFDGDDVDEIDRDTANRLSPDWADGSAVGAPSWFFREGDILYFDVRPSPTAELALIGESKFPAFIATEPIPNNPFAFLPVEYETVPLEYVLSMIPPGNVAGPNGAQVPDTRGISRATKFAALWNQHMPKVREYFYFKDLEDYTP
jgi:hypothetical protein